MAFPILAGFMAFIIILTVILKGNSKKESEAEADFWKRENEANSTRRQDISTLDYIVIDKDALPFGCTEDADIRLVEEEVLALSEKKILNFEGVSNTELKERYGAPNLDILIECDEAFINLCRLLNSWGTMLFDIEMLEESRLVLEFAVEIKSDIAATYTTLAKIYKRLKLKEKLSSLERKAAALNSASRDNVLKKLETYIA